MKDPMKIVSGKITMIMPNPISRSFFIFVLSKEIKSIIRKFSRRSKKYKVSKQPISTRVPYTVHHDLTDRTGDSCFRAIKKSIIRPWTARNKAGLTKAVITEEDWMRGL